MILLVAIVIVLIAGSLILAGVGYIQEGTLFGTGWLIASITSLMWLLHIINVF